MLKLIVGSNILSVFVIETPLIGEVKSRLCEENMDVEEKDKIKENNKLAILLFFVVSFTAGYTLKSLFQVLLGEANLRPIPESHWGAFVIMAPFLIYAIVKMTNTLLRISLLLFMVFFLPLSTVFPFMEVNHVYIADLIVMFALLYCIHLYFKKNIY